MDDASARAGPILLVDDDDATRDSMRGMLEIEGYEVRTARDADDALQQLRGGLRPCLILLDLVMPGKTGFQFRYEQLQDPRLASIALVVYSGHHDIIVNAARLGAAAYFQKPVDVEPLLKLVRTHCGDSHPSDSP